MEEGSFNPSGNGRGQPFLTPETPTGNSNYQVNVKRTKTKKWVEAKVQNYDGDDWGAEEYDDESDESEPAPAIPQLSTSQRPPPEVKGTPSQHLPSSSSAIPPLNVQTTQTTQTTQPPAPVAPVNQPRHADVTSPVVSDLSSARSPSDRGLSERLVSPQSATNFRDNPASFPTADHQPSPVVNQAQPQSTASPPNPQGKALPFVRPSDIYRRMEEEKERERRSSDSGRPHDDTPANDIRDRSASPSKLAVEQKRKEIDRDDVSELSQHSYTNLDTIPERQSEYGLQSIVLSQKQYTPPSKPPRTPVQQEDTHAESDPASEFNRGRMSTSPKLPDVARMSAFGLDLFSSTTNDRTEPEVLKQDHSVVKPTVSVVPPEEDTAGTPKPLETSPQQPPAASQSFAVVGQDNTGISRKAAVQDAYQKYPSETEGAPLAQAPATEKLPDQAAEPVRIQDGAVTLPLRPDLSSIPPLRTPGSPKRSEDPAKVAVDNGATQPASNAPVLAAKVDEHVDFDPRPIEREATFSTVTSSPLKDSDVLSDEIMRSLSPRGLDHNDTLSGEGRKDSTSGSHNAIRDSSYTLKDYDTYWADAPDKAGTGDKGAPSASRGPSYDNPVEPVPLLPAVAAASTASTVPAAPAAPAAVTASLLSPPQESDESNQPGHRRRFSWEATEDAVNAVAIARQAPKEAEVAAPIQLVIPPQEPGSLSTENTDNHFLPSLITKTQDLAPNSPAVSHQVSKSSTTPPREDPEPPSPVSFLSDKNSGAVRETTRISLADEKALAHSTSDLVSTTPEPEGHPALAASPTASTQAPAQSLAQIPAFRDIMGMTTPDERIAKYNETRKAYASMDSGLDNWLAKLRAQHPEHAGATSAFYGGNAQPSGPGANAPSLAGSQAPPAQQPYYQQYLNASSPGTGASPASRSRLAGLPIPTQVAGSAFGHSGNQIGTKSKEFMQSAGKMGKGLLSKGKSKLRGSGDKGESNPPTVQQKLKNERRTSWGLTLGPKPRTDGPAPPSIGHPEPPRAHKSTPPPQLPQLTFNPQSEAPAALRSRWDHSPEPEVSNPKRSSALDLRSGLFARRDSPKQLGEAQNHSTQEPSKPTIAADDQSSDDWVMVSNRADQAAAPAGPVLNQSRDDKPPSSVVPQDSGVGLLPNSQSQADGDAPQRNSSFIGLPPIRRGSTFGLTSKARKATERFPLDDENADSVVADQLQPNEAPNAEYNATKVPEAVQAVPAGNSPVPRLPESKQAPDNLEQRTPLHVQTRGLLPPGRTPEPVISQPRAPSSPHMFINPVQRLQTSGPWKLEESHLSEPLHTVTKNRPDTAGSQQQVLYGYDKETGISIPLPPAPSTQPSQPRSRNSDVPPSSAQRYPDLFAPRPDQEHQQRGRTDPRTSGQPYPHQFQSRLSRDEVMFPRTQTGPEYEIPGVGPPAEERGRQKRNSGIFKEIGTRLSRATSRERRSSLVDSQPAPASLRGDDASESSVLAGEFQERKKRRSSFLFGVSGRPSADHGADERRGSTLAHSQSQPQLEDSAPSTPTHSQAERKRSFFGAAASSISAAQQKLRSSGGQRSSTSHLATEARGDVDSTEPSGPPKKRFSDLAKVPGISGIFHRAGKESVSSQGDPAQNISRRGTTESFDIQPPGPFSAENSGRRSRRGSASNILSGFLGRRPESINQDQSHVPPSQTDMGNSHALVQGPASSNFVPGSERLPEGQGPATRDVQFDPSRSTAFDESHSAQGGFNRSSQQSAVHIRPSPLGQESPMTQGGSTTPVASNEYSDKAIFPGQPSSELKQSQPSGQFSVADSNNAHQQTRVLTEDAALSRTQEQDQRVNEREVPRSDSVSPDISLVSDRRMSEQPTPFQDDAHSRANSFDVLPSSHLDKPDGATETQILDQADEIRPTPPGLSPPQPVEPEWTADSRQHEKMLEGPIRAPHPPTAQGPSRIPAAPVSAQSGPGSIPPERPLPPAPHQSPAGGGHRFDPRPQQQEQQLMGGPRQPHSAQHESQYGDQRTAGLQQAYQPSNASLRSEQPSRLSGTSIQQDNGLRISNRDRAQSVTSEGQEGSGFRWRDLRSRVTEQMAQVTAQNQNKPDRQEKADKEERAEKAEKLTAAKILGAFKRGPKPIPSQPIQQAQQWPGNSPTAQQAQFRGPGPHPRQSPPMNMYSAGNNGLQAGNQARASPGQQAQAMSMAPHQWQNEQQPGRAPGYQQQPPDVTQAEPRYDRVAIPQGYTAEPQYDQVPIPQGYTAVHGEGSRVPSAYNVGRVMPPSQLYNNPRQVHVAQRPYAHRGPGAAQMPTTQIPAAQMQAAQIQAAQTTPGSHRSPRFSPPLAGRGMGGEPGQGAGVAWQDGSPTIPPQSRWSPVANNKTASLGGQSSPSIHQRLDGVDKAIPPRRAEDDGRASVAAASETRRPRERETSIQSGVPSSVAASEVSRPASVNTAAAPEANRAQGRASDDRDAKGEHKLEVDVQKANNDAEDDIYDATPRVTKDATGESSAPSQVSRLTSGDAREGEEKAKAVAKTDATQHTAELEDTEDVRARTMRLDAQEEKILYFPDEEGEEPTMSATSYPGQEWNPYGEPEFGDWRDD